MASDRIAILKKKILQDPIYGPAYELLGSSLEAMFDAGFFDDGAREESNIIPEADDNFFLTPVDKIRRRLEATPSGPAPRLAVLLMTGSFCPVHEGHIESLEIARQELEARGIHVLGGYLSPSHDSYVSIKLTDALSAVQRLDLCQAATADSDWISADGWEAFGVDRAANFTDVVVRLERYLARHIKSDSPIDVYYVFSSDHARFCRAFVARGHCVCTVRPDYRENVDKYQVLPHVKDNDRIIWAMKDRLKTSSGMVRDGSHELLPGKARKIYEQILEERSGRLKSASQKVLYRIRDEGLHEVEHWLTGRDQAMMKQAKADHLHGLVELMCSVHRQVGVIRTQTEVVACIDEAARIGARSLFKISSEAPDGEADEAVISIDAFISGDISLGVSRCFALADAHGVGQISHRPGYRPLAEQIASIPRNRRYLLVDDDIDTGRTMSTVWKMLADAGVNISAAHALIKRSSLKKPGLTVDVLDARDFLSGSRRGGLVVQLPDGKLGRVPYCLPYCSPSQRASIPLALELEFSLGIWSLNQRFFKGLQPAITLSKADPGFQAVMQYFGFSPQTKMADICRWHAEQCRLAIARYKNAARPAYDLPVTVA